MFLSNNGQKINKFGIQIQTHFRRYADSFKLKVRISFCRLLQTLRE